MNHLTLVAVLALRELRPRAERAEQTIEARCQSQALHRCTRRYCSQREQFYHARSFHN